MVRRITLSTKNKDAVIRGIITGIPKTVRYALARKIFPAMETDMREIMDGWDGYVSKNGDSVYTNFEYTSPSNAKTSNTLNFSNVSGHSTALVEGVMRTLIKTEGWINKVNVNSDKIKKHNGKWPTHIWVGGPNSRIKEGNSQRDFWNPVIDKYFGASGTATKEISNELYRELKKKTGYKRFQ